jgi:putative transposase
MANTYTQMPVHVVVAVKYRRALILDHWRDDLHKYMTGIVQGQRHKMLCINSMPDHLHALIEMRPDQCLSDLMRMLKADSSRWVNKQKLSRGHFLWQEGFGAFNVSKRFVHLVACYIENQEFHHRDKTLRAEMINMFEDQQIEFDKRYLFSSPI